jgi:DNA topoisomerase-1
MRPGRKLPLDPERSAAAAGLQYLRDEAAGFSRRRRGRGFTYLDCAGRCLKDPRHVQRIRALAIPPAWKRVWICPVESGHLQAIGYDARGRKQYRYHAAYRAIRNQTKFEHLAGVVNALADIRETVRRQLALPGMPREKVLATVIRLIDRTGIRVGNQESAAENKTFGLTTLCNRHVEIEGSTLHFRFTGKSGVRQDLEITDLRVARIVRQCHDLPGHQLFEYVDDDGKPRGVSSTDVNAWLREVSGQALTAKDLRTWAGTVECATALRDIGEFASPTEGKRNIVAAIKTAAERLGNRAATCRAYYVHPAVPEAYLAGSLLPAMSKASSNGSSGPSRLSGTSQWLSPDELAILEVIRRHREMPAELSMTA